MMPGIVLCVNDDRAAALAAANGLAPTATNLSAVASRTTPEAARWAFEQHDLRIRAAKKFSRASEMLFVREALEQATDERLAAYHASLFPEDANVVDLTTGIGADLIALAKRGPASGYEVEPDRVEFARHNLAVYGVNAEVFVEDSMASGSSDADYVFADPARRVAGRRTLDIGEFQPDPRAIAERFRDVRLGVIKLSPLLRDESLSAIGPSVRFLSYGRECREALVCIGQDARAERLAIHVESGGTLTAGGDPVVSAECGSFLYDCDPAAVRAHAIAALAGHHALSVLGDSLGYLTGGATTATPWLRPYRVVWSGKADDKAVRRALVERSVSVAEVKVRGATIDSQALMHRFRGTGRPVSLVVWPNGRSLRYTLVEPLRGDQRENAP